MIRRYLPALLVCLVVMAAVALVSARQSMLGAPSGPTSTDAVRLGPEPGQQVAAYLAALTDRLPPPGAGPVPALVQLTAGMDGSSVAGLPARALPVKAVFRVSLTRVQTALRFQPLSPVDDPDPIAGRARQLALAQAEAQRSAAAEAARLTGRPARVAEAEAEALASPGCRCVLALLVDGDREALDALVRAPGVRAVDAAPTGTPLEGVSLAPLLPEQSVTVGPVPDDGPLPPP
jgi:hypothetical protein